jgi:hypothetical protein
VGAGVDGVVPIEKQRHWSETNRIRNAMTDDG